MPRIVSSSPPPNAAIPGRFKIPVSGSIAPVGAAVTVTAACPDELLLELPPPLELLLEDDELEELELELLELDELDELDELLELLDDELELLELDELEELDDEELDELELDELDEDELAAATVKATLQFPPPNHSSARGRLLGAVGT